MRESVCGWCVGGCVSGGVWVVRESVWGWGGVVCGVCV